MKKFLAKFTALTLCVFMLFSILAACGGEAKGGDTTTTAGAATTAPEPADTPVKITFATPVVAAVDKGSDLEVLLNSLVPGLTVELVPIERPQYYELLNPRLAAGDIPDIIFLESRTKYDTYAKQGVLYQSSIEDIKKNMPKIYAAINEFGADVWAISTIDGKIYGLPQTTLRNTRPFTNAWRKDWLDTLGITAVPSTLQEYEDALVKIVNNDPDQNGKKDTYGFTNRGKDAPGFMGASVFAAFGMFPNMWNLQPDGSIKYGITDPRAKQAFEVLNKWFKMGLIDPEFATVDNNMLKQKWVNGQVGLYAEGTYYNNISGADFYDALKAANPKAEVTLGPAPKGPDGKYGYFNWGKFTGGIAWGKNLDSEPTKKDKTMQLLERLLTEEDTYIAARFGSTEGTHWERLADGSIVSKAPYNDPKNAGKLGINFLTQSISPMLDVQAAYMSRDEAKNYRFAIEGNVKEGVDYFPWVNNFIGGDIVAKYRAGAEPLMFKNYIDFITGARPLSEFDKFIEEWMAAGGADYEKAAQESFKNTQVEIHKAVKAVE